MGQHGSALGSILLGLDGFEVTAAEVIDDEWRLGVQTTATAVGCVVCGSQGRLHARRTVQVRDLPIGGRPVVLAWRKRIWRCVEPACAARTWTEQTVAIGPRVVLTERARAETCRRVGKDAHAVAAVARDLGVGWATAMRAVRDHGQRLVEDPARLDGVTALGLDETSFLRATPTAPTQYVTGLVDVEGGRLLDVIADRTTRAVTAWLGGRPRSWLAGVGTVALDPWRGYASALVAPLGHATVVVDHFHAIKLANTVVGQVRRRTQQALLGHRGRKHDPLSRIRKLLVTAVEQLTGRGRARLRVGLAAGDRFGEVAAAWQGKELLRAVYAAGDLASARAALDRFYRWCDGVQILELTRLARTGPPTRRRWPGCSPWPRWPSTSPTPPTGPSLSWVFAMAPVALVLTTHLLMQQAGWRRPPPDPNEPRAAQQTDTEPAQPHRSGDNRTPQPLGLDRGSQVGARARVRAAYEAQVQAGQTPTGAGLARASGVSGTDNDYWPSSPPDPTRRGHPNGDHPAAAGQTKHDPSDHAEGR